MKITVTVTVEVERADGSYTKTTERREHTAGDNPRFEAAECFNAIDATLPFISRRLKACLVCDGTGGDHPLCESCEKGLRR